MTVSGLLEHGFREVVLSDGDREIDGCYMGDLLSWVMGRAQADNAWITIMSNLNVVAVASLADTACVILTEGVELPDDVRAAAEMRDVNVLSTDLPSYDAAVLLSTLI
ncbi:MAG: hypothetical protein IJL78_10825 [Lachnospiraceae bacterium]|nr:hypothetical protein [Lachnospiraceae bacterium]